MALKATIHKAELQIADMDRNHYADYALTLARHPSETDERLMVRLLVFALNADPALAFCKGLSDTDEPDLWRKDLTGAIEQWIEVGQPDERRIAKACGRAREVLVYAYGRSAGLWWGAVEGRLARLRNLTVFRLPAAETQALADLAGRSMKLSCSIQEGHVWLADAATSVQLQPVRLLGPG